MPPTRTKPYPFDLTLAFVQPALGGPGGGEVVDPDGNAVEPGSAGRLYGLITRDGLVSRRVDPLGTGTFPEAQEYAAADVYKERSFVYRRSYLGMGERTQNGALTPRYYYGWNAQTHGTMRGRGPAWHEAQTLGAAEGPVLGFVEGLHNGALTLFVLAGRYVRRHAGDLPGQQPVSLDLGPGNYARSACRWSPAEGSYGDRLLLTDNLSRLWQYDGTVWSQLTASGGADLVWSTQWELWRAFGWEVSKTQSDPSDPSNWTLPTPAGDETCEVSGLADVSNRMYFFKENGSVWSQQSTTDNVPLFRGMEEAAQPYNGRNPAPWQNQIYFRVGDGFYRLSGTETATFDRVGLERLQTNTSPVRGPIRCFAGYAGYYGFAGAFNPHVIAPDGFEGPCSFLLRYGNWVPSEGDEEGVSAFVDGYDGAQIVWEGRRISALGVVTTEAVIGAPAEDENPRLYAGFEDGTYGWIRLPSNGPNPFDPSSGCDFTDEVSFIRWPRHSMDAPADLKGYLSVDVTGPYLDPYRWVTLSYRIDPDGESAPWAQLGRPLWQNQERITFPAPTLGKIIEIREDFGASPPPADPGPNPSPYPPGPTLEEWLLLPTPVVSAVVLREQLRPAFRAEYGFTLRGEDWAPLRNGATSRLTAPEIRDLLRKAADAPSTVRLTLTDETAGDFTLVTYGEKMVQAGAKRRYGLTKDIQVTMVAYRTQQVRGIFARYFDMVYSDLDPDFTYADADEL
jgi:hypothetical protein